MEFYRSENGITLVALVVTIIIMLILVVIAVSVTFAENGLFTKAQEATHEWNQKQQEEIAYTNDININSLVEGSQEDSTYIEPKTGDYVNYEEYVTEKPYTAYATETGYTTDQIYTTETNVRWKILDITEDGNIVLISEMPVNKNNGIDDEGLYLRGAIGYNNAEIVLNNMCRTMYSTEVGEARSLTFEDVAKVTGWDKVEQDAKYSCWNIAKADYERNYNYTFAYHPEINNGTTQANFSVTNTGDWFSRTSLDSIYLLNPGSTIVSLIFGPPAGSDEVWKYWLASRATLANDSHAGFGIGCVHWESANNCSETISYTGGPAYASTTWFPVRVVVELDLNTTLVLEASTDGVSSYKIQQ